MEAGAVGGAMCMGGAGMMGAGAMSSSMTSGGDATVASAGCATGTSIQGMTPQMQALVDLMGSMSSAQILIALMMSGAGKKKDQQGDPFAALMGLAIAGQMQQLTSGLAQMLSQGNAQTACGGGAVGTQLNVLT